MVAGLAGAGQLRLGSWVGFVTLPGKRGAVQHAVPPVTHTALSPVRSAWYMYIEWSQLVHRLGLLRSVTDTHSMVSGFGGPGQRVLYFFSKFGGPIQLTLGGQILQLKAGVTYYNVSCLQAVVLAKPLHYTND